MAKRPTTIERDGQFWFALRYAAELLHATARKIEALIRAGQLASREDEGDVYVAERDVTVLRRDPAALAALKRAVREKAIIPPKAPKAAPSRVADTTVPHTILPTAPPIVIDPFANRRADQQVLPWTTDRSGFARSTRTPEGDD